MYLYKILIFCLFGLSSIFANSSSYRIERLSLEKGISHNTVFSIIQDSEKYIWFGTMFGLIRYDGREYVKYRTDPFHNNTLSDDDIVTVYEASDGRLWIGTFGGGINVFDKDSLIFKRFDHENPALTDWNGIVWDIIEDSNNNIWITTGNEGIIKISSLNESIEQIKNTDSTKNLSSNYLQTITKDNSGIWFGGYGGLTHYDEVSKKLIVYSDKNIENVFFKDIVFITNDMLLCATSNGLYSFIVPERKFSKLENTNAEILNSIDVNSILKTRTNQIWLGTKTGIYVCDNDLNLIEYISDENGLYNNSVVSLHEDLSGIIWVGSYLGGVSKLIKTDQRFSFIEHDRYNSKSLTKGYVKSFAIDRQKNVWVCTSDGITKLKNDFTVENSYSSQKLKDQLEMDLRFTSIEIDKNNNLYLGTNQGVLKVDSKFKLLNNYTKNKYGLSADVVTKLLIDSQNNLWVGTVFGLSRINLDDEKVTNWNSNTDPNKIVGQNVLSLFEDSEGMIWLGTYRGLNKLNPLTNEVEFKGPAFNDETTISNKYIFDFFEEDSVHVWIATGNGINIYNRDSKRYDLLNTKNGLANGVIESLTNFRDKVYISTNYGISIFDKNERTIQNYNSNDGLGNNIFCAGASILTPDNIILFGGLKGISVIDPENIITNENLPENKITSVKIFDEEIKPIEWNSNLELEYSQNSVTIDFAGLEFTNPLKNQFAYRLEGIDEVWKYTENNSITYHHLPHNKYIFYLKSSNSEGLWNYEAAEFVFIIHPPFWKTYWFYGILIIAISGSALFIHYKRLQSKLKVFLKIEEAKQEENESVRKRAAEDFHDELGHHLTRISLLIELLKRKFVGTEIEKAEDINRLGIMAKELSNKMRDFIWSLDSQNNTLYDLVIRLKDFGDDLFYDTAISFKLNGVNDKLKDIKLSLDWRRHLTLIFKEAMNNIVKYSKCENVELKIDKQNKYIKIELLDDGNGFDLIKTKRGNGLKNMKTRAEYLKAKLAINSQLNNGTQIILEGTIT